MTRTAATVTKNEETTSVVIGNTMITFDRTGGFVGASWSCGPRTGEELPVTRATIARARRAHDKAWANGR